ncbi:DNA-binding response regulator [Paenibacillus baekrokdamisoli]|uniref:DNA-binding response regulator n=1 Tax=Paenibacillus baekrokdamisoli TaxID=1712516 RepID=A0A3G9JAG1_9BACL|nr:response regulator transcription factor [Paenibacillus baekrokdamisoli]MBB3071617.1 DNA-binding response OmpR family regulator [Paenibacillus baekrokdamisoli]BBH21873.1 DNA-binding response regulator [Paenibacillus baekrokdamisoli]
MQILIADDERDMLKILRAYFEKEGYKVFEAEDGEKALEIFYREKIDLAILDWMMPKVNGLEVCMEIKARSDKKVLILTAKSEQEDELKALHIGADEFIRKPFHPKILVLRVKKLLGDEKDIHYHNIRIALEGNKLYLDGRDVQATKTEFELMHCLVRNKGNILTRHQLLDLVWGLDYFGDERTVDTHIRRLRAKVGEAVIKTNRGLGYSVEGAHE